MPTLSETIILATTLHAGQEDRAGKPYILHVLRVMLAMQTDEERLVALLHDVVEDGHATLEDLRARGYTAAIVEAVDTISRRKAAGETYRAFIERVSANALARRVKLADLRDNLGRLSEVADPAAVASLRQRYEDALRVLAAAQDDGA